MAATGSRWLDPGPWALAAWGALVAVTAFPPASLGPLALALPAPLWALAVRCEPRRGFLLGWIQGLGFFGALLWWIAPTVARYGGLPWPAAVGCVALLAAYLALYPGACGWACAAVGRRRPGLALALAPFVWTGLEGVRGWALTGFPWGDVAQALWNQPLALRLAPWVGADGIRLVGVGLAVAPAWLLARGAVSTRALAVPTVAALTWAGLALAPSPLPPADATLRVGVVQGNIDQAQKWDRAYRRVTLDIYERLTLDLVPRRPQLVVWPETAVPLSVQDGGPETSRLLALARRAGVWLLFGAPGYERVDGRVEYRNSVFLVTPEGTWAGRYDKVHLVPFGEYVPFGRYLPFLKKMVEGAGDFSPGPGVRPLSGPGLPTLGPLICFEGIFPGLAARHAEQGARLLVVVTNDAWFGRTPAPYQHLAFAALRAAETGLPLVRAANTGVSAVFDRRGRPLTTTVLGARDAFVAEVELPPPGPTPQAAVRPWISPTSLALAGLTVFAILRGPRRHPRT
ncbi:apolipoprotein N-acyltransferase [Deferrisoma camini]|uniref:apolipoprotein N-acyltransferase n=1 Tax=Deferrisoma camini TaxID=1035120 RepID=UPI00046D60A9|nr:apolipoprotein N-acyltransferase [Deferrisoma camini]